MIFLPSGVCTCGAHKRPAASFPESDAERDQRRKERADKARPNVSMTPGQAQTLNAVYLNERSQGNMDQPQSVPRANSPKHGWWMKPRLHRAPKGGCLLFGPVQFNWYSDGFRVHFTWPFRSPKTVTLWQK